MKNCPPDFYNNCSNSIFKCKFCKAGSGSYTNKLYYKPIIDNNTQHPALLIQKNTTKSKHSKLGRKEEQKIVQSLIKQTINSGALFNDGDIAVGDLKLDPKKRTVLFKKAYTLIAQDVPYVFLFNRKYEYYAISKKMKSPGETLRYDFEKLS